MSRPDTAARNGAFRVWPADSRPTFDAVTARPWYRTPLAPP
jgi:hypothetical protein